MNLCKLILTRTGSDQLNNSILGTKADPKTLAVHSLVASLIGTCFVQSSRFITTDYPLARILTGITIGQITAKHLMDSAGKESLRWKQIGTLIPARILEAALLARVSPSLVYSVI